MKIIYIMQEYNRILVNGLKVVEEQKSAMKNALLFGMLSSPDNILMRI